jgi:transposase
MQGYALTDFEWEVIAPLLPNKPRCCEDSAKPVQEVIEDNNERGWAHMA